jgi:hypothetical protein
MSTRLLPFCLLLCLMVVPCARAANAGIQISTPDGAAAQFEAGALVSFTDAAGRVFVQDGELEANLLLRHLSGEAAPERAVLSGATEISSGFEGVPGGRVTSRYAVEDGRFTITQEASTTEPGLWGISMQVARIPLDMSIIVPGRSGIRLDRKSPGREHVFDYPMTWEAQFVLVEDDAGNGICVSAEDFSPHLFKRLVVRREDDGWRIECIAMPFAPFDKCTAWGPVQWFVRPYEGGFRAGAAEYRKALMAAAEPLLLAEQQPAWAGDIRTVVIAHLKLDQLEELAGLFDPAKVMLYVPAWRASGYDREYPDYDNAVPELGPYMKRARELGFRVMLHVNYFGCQADHPAYAEMQPYHLRSEWGNHGEQWWLWDRVEPEIKFAYINPAYKGWRDLFVGAMVQLCAEFEVDALHIDQTLVIQNDHNGLIDGMSMIDGAIAIHRELRAALPHVALSGEGLNEVTFPFEAFAQRHAWGIQPSNDTFDRKEIALAHPVASYLFRPYTGIYGYLGVASPANGQLYAAWQEAYRHMGVIPALSMWGVDLGSREGFMRQAVEEMRFWQDAELIPDVDGPWSADTAFPFRTASGEPARYTKDGRLMHGEREVARIVVGATEVRGAGTIPGWLAFDAERIFGLDPDTYYPYFTGTRDAGVFHVSALPDGFTVGNVAAADGMAMVETRRARSAAIRLSDLLDDAVTGTRMADGAAKEGRGELFDDNGGTFGPGLGGIVAHPPYRGGTGVTFARFTLPDPGGSWRFYTAVSLRPGAEGPDRSDGVTFRVTARSGGNVLTQELHHALEKPADFEMIMASVPGEDIELELETSPGPDDNPSHDWAFWGDPVIEPTGQKPGAISVKSPGGGWRMFLAGEQSQVLDPTSDSHRFEALHPGTFHLLAEEPAEVSLPCDLTSLPFTPFFMRDSGGPPDSMAYAIAEPGSAVAEGVERHGFSVHPPNNGQTRVCIPMTLPDTPARFTGYAGMRDGALEGRVDFLLLVNGLQVAKVEAAKSGWHPVECDLSEWRGKPVVLELIADSAGSNTYDWAFWTDLRVERVTE